MTPPKRRSRRRRILTGCGSFLAAVAVLIGIVIVWLYYTWGLADPEPRPVDHYVTEDIDAFVSVNVREGDVPVREFIIGIAQALGTSVSASVLPEFVTGDLGPDATVFDLPGVLPAHLTSYYRFRSKETGDEVYTRVSFPRLPLTYAAGGAIGIRRWGDQLAAQDGSACWACEGVPVVRWRRLTSRMKRVSPVSRIPVRETNDLYLALANRTLLLSRDPDGVRRAIGRFHSGEPGGISGRLKQVWDRIDPASDVVAVARKQKFEILRLLRMTEDTPPWELRPDETMKQEFFIDPDVILGAGLQIDFETADRVRCKVVILCPDTETAGTNGGIWQTFLERVGSPKMTCKVRSVKVDGPIVEIEFTADGLLQLIRYLIARERIGR